MKMKKQTSSGPSILAIGAGIVAAGAASYYLFGPEGKHHRHALKGWMIRMKGEIVDKLEDMKEVTEPMYHQIVDSVVEAYRNNNKVAAGDLDAYAQKLKGQWKRITSEKHLKKIALRGTKVKK